MKTESPSLDNKHDGSVPILVLHILENLSDMELAYNECLMMRQHVYFDLFCCHWRGLGVSRQNHIAMDLCMDGYIMKYEIEIG